MTEHTIQEEVVRKGAKRTFVQTVWVSAEYLSVRVLEAFVANARIMREETDLFLGAVLFLLGALNWSSAKYCDGNSSDYLSCTRPATYYYYGAFEILLIVLGVVLVLLWFVKRQRTR